MANKSYFVYDKENDEFIPIKLIDAGDGTYRMAVEIEGASFGDVSIGDIDVASHPTDTFAADAQAYGKGVLVQGDDGTDRRAMLVDTDGHPQVDIVAEIPAGTQNIGDMDVISLPQVIQTISFTPTIQAAAYASKDVIAALETLAGAVRVSGGSGIIETVVVNDLSYQKKAMDLVFFNADPDSTSFDLNVMFDPDDADLPKIIGIVEIESTDWAAFKDSAAVCKSNLGIAFSAVGSADIYVVLIARYTTTYASTSDLSLHISILQD